MSSPPVTPEDLVEEAPPKAQGPFFRRNGAWLLLLGLTVLIVLVGLTLTSRGLRLSALEQQQTRREQLLSTQLGDLSQILMATQVQAWTVLGTGSSEDSAAFSQQCAQLRETLSHLRAPDTFPELRRQRLERLPQQVEALLKELQDALQRRREGRLAEATAQLQRSRVRAEGLTVTLRLLREEAQDAVRDRQRDQENARIGLRAELMVHSALLALLFLAVYLTLRRERELQQKRERRLRRENQQLQALTEEDGLTGVQNRRSFDNRLRMEWRRARRYGLPLSILLLDVDHFGKYNKDFGVQVGDEVLRRLAGALAQTARLTDTIARYGGEEFVILLPHTGVEESQIVGERLRTILAHTDWPHRPVTASVGLATLNEKIKDADMLVRAADEAMRYAKTHGRDQVIHWEQL